MYSVKVRSGIWNLASSYRLFTRRQFEYVVATSLMPKIEPETLARYREDFVRGYMPTYNLEYPNPYDSREPVALLSLLRESFHYVPDSTHALLFQLKYFYVRAGLLIPVAADELVRASNVGSGSGEGSAPRARAEAFEYRAKHSNGGVEQLAASTNNPEYAAKMLGYDRKTFGDLVHTMKYDLGLRGDDNVLWHDNGNVEFGKKIIGNMHDYAR